MINKIAQKLIINLYRNIFPIVVGIFFIFCIGNFSSCRNFDDFDVNAVTLQFSQDTVKFDTVFSTLNTITKRIKVFNPSKKDILISKVYMQEALYNRPNSSPFRLNVDGDTSLIVNNLIIRGKDSIFIFIKATIDYQNANNPIEIHDNIVFEFEDESRQYLAITAWGQDAYYLQSDRIHKIPFPNPEDPLQIDTQYLSYFFWDNEEVKANKPYVIYGYLTVKSNEVFRVPAGARFHFAPNSGIWIQSGGRIEVNGNLSQVVRFEGIRMDGSYNDMPGQWGKIWIEGECYDNSINYAIIKNGLKGIEIDSVTMDALSLTLNNTQIYNMSIAGIHAKNTILSSTNTVVANSNQCVLLEKGGTYSFIQCTFLNYKSTNSNEPSYALILSDIGTIGEFKKAEFANTIIHGGGVNQIDFKIKNLNLSSYFFDHCIIKQDQTPTESFNNCKFNVEPKFVNIGSLNFAIADSISPAVGAGNSRYVTGVAEFDIMGVRRPRPGSPTIGAYEYVKP